MGFQTESDGEDPIAQLIHNMSKKAEDLGLYLREVAITQMTDQGPRPVMVESHEQLIHLILSGQVDIKMLVVFQIGELAFAKRNEDPDGHQVDVTASELIPPEHRLLKERIQDMLNDGKTIEDLFNDGDDGLAGV